MEVVAKGGNLLLGVGPTAEGLIEQPSIERLQKIGNWMQKNGQAIYNTRITPNYHSGNIWFTADKNGKTLYALYALPEGEKVPATIEWEGNIPARHSKIRLLSTGKSLKWIEKEGKVIITIPKRQVNTTEPLAFRFEVEKAK